MAQQRTPRNTTAADSWDHFMVAASPGGIEAQEAAGQREVVNSTILPVSGSESEELRELGFTFGAMVKGADLFREATIPEGWAREGGDHAMHSYVLDERGIRRVNIFYKAAFYDRRADMHVMNVGYDVATHWIYGDGNYVIPDGLTDEEKADARAQAEGYIAKAADPKTGHIYTDRAPNAQSLLEALS